MRTLKTTTPPKDNRIVLTIPPAKARMPVVRTRANRFGDSRLKRQGTRQARTALALRD